MFKASFLKMTVAASLVLPGLVLADNSALNVKKLKKSAPAVSAAATTSTPTTPSSATQATSTSSETVSVTSPTTEQKFFGLIDLRPSYITQQGEVHSENTLEGGYQLNKTMKVSYVQYFSTNLLSNVDTTKGLNLLADDGFFKFKANDVWASNDGANTFSYQGRLYTPTNKVKADAGYLTTIRNQFKLAHKFSELVSVDFNYIPILHAYSKSGVSTGGVDKANPVGEHLFVLNTDVHITPKLLFSLPIIYQYTKYRQYGNAKFSDKWGQNLWIWPEVDYDINEVHTVGVAYYTDNFMDPLGSGLTLSDGFTKGVAQLLWTVNL